MLFLAASLGACILLFGGKASRFGLLNEFRTLVIVEAGLFILVLFAFVILLVQ
jgi:hypothetical protein